MRDHHHRRCAELLLNHPGPLVVPLLVITEVCQVLESRCGATVEASFLDSLRTNELTLIEPTQGDFGRIAELAERFDVTEVATLDHRHFKVVRPRHIEAFTLLPD